MDHQSVIQSMSVMDDGRPSVAKREAAMENYSLLVPKHIKLDDGLPPFRKAKEAEKNVALRFLWVKGRALAVDRVSRSTMTLFITFCSVLYGRLQY